MSSRAAIAAIGGIAAIAASLLAGCGSSTHTTGSASSVATSPLSGRSSPSTGFPSLRLASAAFAFQGAIPSTYTCDGADISLPVRWSGVPRRTRELVLVMRDPDAPGGNFIHWAVARISPTVDGFAAGHVPGGVVQGRNSFGKLGYGGPCPPAHAPAHHYVLTLSALAAPSRLRPGFSAERLHAPALAVATLVGTYTRK